MTKIVWLVGVLMLARGAVASTELPTLLFSATERQTVQQMRSGGVVASQSAVRYTGVVQRSGGQNTVWLNAQAHTQGAPTFPPTQAQNVLLEGQSLRVGDQLDTVSRKVLPLLPEEALQKREKK
jgi:hypothetical protein